MKATLAEVQEIQGIISNGNALIAYVDEMLHMKIIDPKLGDTIRNIRSSIYNYETAAKNWGEKGIDWDDGKVEKCETCYFMDGNGYCIAQDGMRRAVGPRESCSEWTEKK